MASRSIKMITTLLDMGANQNIQNEKNQTQLHLAAVEGKTDVINLFLKCGAIPDIQDINGFMPIDYAIQNDSAKNASLFLDDILVILKLPPTETAYLHQLIASARNIDQIYDANNYLNLYQAIHANEPEAFKQQLDTLISTKIPFDANDIDNRHIILSALNSDILNN